MTNRRAPNLYNLSRRKFIKYGSLTVGAGIVAACTGNQTNSSGADESADLGENPIKVGVMYSTTGTIAIVEKSLQDATFLAIEQINNGTDLGRLMAKELGQKNTESRRQS